jgi:molecular chaperone DnaK (HSP70)
LSGSSQVAVGFDFGTSTTLIASTNGIIDIGQESAGHLSAAWMPSVAAVTDDGTTVVGEEATLQVPEQTARSIKRSITEGRTVARLDTPTGIRDVRTDDLMVEVFREAMRRAVATRADLATATDLRLGCPAMWDGRQRRRLLDIAQRAGLPVGLDSLVDEPVAAGIAWLAYAEVSTVAPKRVLVFDMGGGTLDVAVLEVRGRRRPELAVLAAIGVAEAGDALDDAIAEDLASVLTVRGVDMDSLDNPTRARTRLVYAAREAKEGLSVTQEHAAVLPKRQFGVADVWYTRDQLEQVFADQIDRAEQTVITALKVARMTEGMNESAYSIMQTPVEQMTATIDAVVLSGGMTRIPYVKQRLQQLFGPRTRIEVADIAPDTAVALGLARAGSYGRINMYRPAFDVLLEWEDELRTVYDAFTPLVAPGMIARGGADLRYARNGLDLLLPRKGKGRLRVVPQDGAKVRASLNGRNLDGFTVALSEQRFEFRIYPNGRIHLTDATGSFDGQIDGWHN